VLHTCISSPPHGATIHTCLLGTNVEWAKLATRLIVSYCKLPVVRTGPIPSDVGLFILIPVVITLAHCCILVVSIARHGIWWIIVIVRTAFRIVIGKQLFTEFFSVAYLFEVGIHC